VIEKYYCFDLINSEQRNSYQLRLFSDGMMKVLANVDEGPNTLGYSPGISTGVMISVINDKIAIRVKSGNTDYEKVLLHRDHSIKSGRIGVGTFGTSVRFTSIELIPPRLKLTDNDRNYIQSIDKDEIFFPDVTLIQKTAISIGISSTSEERAEGGQRGKGDVDGSDVSELSSSIGSSIGMDFSSETQITQIIQETQDINSSNNGKRSSIQGTGWKVCVISRTAEERDNYCKKIYNNPDGSKKCAVIIILNIGDILRFLLQS
jgi:hypothetical protein